MMESWILQPSLITEHCMYDPFIKAFDDAISDLEMDS